MSTSSIFVVAPLLRAHQAQRSMSDSALLAAVADAAETTESQARAWVNGSPVSQASIARALLRGLGVDRDLAFAHLDEHLLLAALWCPAVGAALKDAYTASGFTCEEFASAACVSPYSVRRWEAATVTPRLENLKAALAVARLTPADLLARTTWPPSEVPSGPRPAFALWLRRSRAELGLSQGRAAAQLKVTQGAFNAWELGRSFPESTTWAALADGLTKLGAPITAEQLLLLTPAEPCDASEARTDLGAALIKARAASGFSRLAVAHLTGSTRSDIHALERGDRIPDPKLLATLAGALQLDVKPLEVMAAQLRAADIEHRTVELLVTKFAGRPDRGALVSARIEVLGLAAREAAAAIGVHRNVRSFWRTGKLAMPEHVTEPLARILGIDVAVLAARPAAPKTRRQVFAAQLLDARTRRGLKQADVATMVGVNQGDMSAFERAERMPSPRVRALLGELLDVSLAA